MENGKNLKDGLANFNQYQLISLLSILFYIKQSENQSGPESKKPCLIDKF
jgi:hypothetical protein